MDTNFIWADPRLREVINRNAHTYAWKRGDERFCADGWNDAVRGYHHAISKYAERLYKARAAGERDLPRPTGPQAKAGVLPEDCERINEIAETALEDHLTQVRAALAALER